MATQVSKTTFQSTYKDDYADSDNYYRVLFNSGKALQARELTQLQTMIQKQIERFGSNIFVDGGVVNGTGFTVNNGYEFIKLADNQLPSATGSELLNVEFADEDGIKFKIIEVVTAATTGDADTIYVNYTDRRSGTSSTTPVRTAADRILYHPTTASLNMRSRNVSDVSGAGTKVSIGRGSFFVQGVFVYAQEQSLIVSYYSPVPNLVIGFKIDEKIITSSDDTGLFDNQGAVPNVAAPGADRYQIKLSLIDRANIVGAENFVYLFKLTRGKISDEARTDNSYNRINDLMALRTKEESGNYITNDFIANFALDSNNTGPNLLLKVSDGVAYVDGYRIESSAKDISIPKASTTTTINNEVIRATYGNYILINSTNNVGLPDINKFQKMDLKDTANNGGTKIGTARVRAIYKESASVLRVYLFDVKMNINQSFSNVKSLGNTAGTYINPILENSQAVLKNTAQNSLIFPLPRNRPDSLSTDSVTVQRRITFTTGVGVTQVGPITGTLPEGGNGPGAGYQYTNSSQWIISDGAGAVLDITPSAITGTTFTYSGGLTQSKTYEVLVQVIKSSPAARSKSLAETTLSAAVATQLDSDGLGTKYFNLNQADIYKVKSIKQTDSNGADISDNFIIDNGQRDNYYGLGRLIFKPGTSVSGTVFTRYQYFNTGAGDYFDVSSYPASVPYDKIPNYRLSTGETINLRDKIDFRPVSIKGPGDGSKLFGSYLTFDSNNAGGGVSSGFINFLPQTGGTFTADITYYLPRIDKLIGSTITSSGARLRSGDVRVVRGTPDLNPVAPPTPEGAITLYDLKLGANTINDSDTELNIKPAKGYTMADIGRLENRIENLEELTTLSLLELDTAALTVLDSAGLTRTKAGFLVDNFKSFNFAATDRSEYRAIIEPFEGIVEPITIPKNTRLLADSGNSTGLSFRGDAAYLSIDSDEIEINQTLATETLNVNPFAVILSNGHTVLSPETDEWVETKYLPNIITRTNGGTIRAAFGRGAIRNRWSGASVSRSGNTQSISRIVGDRVVDISVIPFMRSRIVAFKTEGLTPNSQHFINFGGQDINAYARQETEFKRISGRQDTNQTYTNATAHPNGATSLISDSSGGLFGTFLIPSNNSLKFRTGLQQFDLANVTGTDPSGGTSKSRAVFQASGQLETRQRTVNVTTFRIVPPPPPPQNDGGDNPDGGQAGDPLAQSFYVDPVDNPNGYFITEVNCYFKTKDQTVPVQCQIRGVQQGFPDFNPLPGAVKFLSPSQVNIPSNVNDMTSVRNTPTTFTFDEPIYVRPGRSYAVVLMAETVEYNAYVAETYQFILGSTQKRVNKQPTLGTLFMSQSGITWTPDQTRDLMFQLKRAKFASSGTLKLQNGNTTSDQLFNNPILTEANSTTVRIFQDGHGFVVNDKATIAGLDSATTYGNIAGSSIMGSRTITKVDHTGFTFEADSQANASLRVGGDGLIVEGQAMFDTFLPQVNTLIPEGTTISSSITTTSGSSFGNNRNTVSNGSKIVQAAKNITLNEFNFTESPQCIFTKTNEAVVPLSGTKSLKLDVTLSTNDNKVSPIIDLQRCSLTSFETVIDAQDSGDFSTFNVPLSLIAETDATEGTAAAKHITVPVTLEEPGKGLKILFAANRPSVSNFKVFFKTATSDEVLDDIGYTLIEEATNNPSDDDGVTYRQYEYLPGGQIGNLPDFTQFQVKIVMNSTNSSKSPKIRDLRIIALVT